MQIIVLLSEGHNFISAVSAAQQPSAGGPPAPQHFQQPGHWLQWMHERLCLSPGALKQPGIL
jgi:hypothetical protein